MTQEVKRYVNDCEICMRVKNNQHPIHGPMSSRPTQTPWTKFAIDTADMTTRSKKGNFHIVVVQDLGKKYIELFPTRDKKATTIVKILESVFERWGTPRTLISDNGKEYCNIDVSTLLFARGVIHHTTPISHPQSNPVEHVNRTVKPMISAFIKDHQSEWDINLWKFQLAYNTSCSTSCRNTSLPTKDKRLAKKNRNAATRVRIQVGSEVYYPNKKLSNKIENYNAKVAHRCRGPTIIDKILGPMKVELVDKTGKKVGKYYVADLKFPRRSLRRYDENNLAQVMVFGNLAWPINLLYLHDNKHLGHYPLPRGGLEKSILSTSSDGRKTLSNHDGAGSQVTDAGLAPTGNILGVRDNKK
ncbi:protein NYNRIN-like [Diachasmimorpha longicaudata]|uniref:protein NYNRIN-like n=1 Tax=Diachasmimorpha longicaudata TaxID=58733 RepID=UPI0030B8E1D7